MYTNVNHNKSMGLDQQLAFGIISEVPELILVIFYVFSSVAFFFSKVSWFMGMQQTKPNIVSSNLTHWLTNNLIKSIHYQYIIDQPKPIQINTCAYNNVSANGSSKITIEMYIMNSLKTKVSNKTFISKSIYCKIFQTDITGNVHERDFNKMTSHN